MRIHALRVLSLVLLLAGASRCPADPARLPLSAAALYNAGNAYARQGEPGLAVLSYERALLLAPDDSDIAANLRAVRRLNGIAAAPANAFADWVARLNPDVCAWLGMVGLMLVVGAALAGRLGRARRAARAVASVAGVLLLALPVGNALALWPTLHAAVTLAKATPLRAAPVPLGDVLATLPEAVTVRIAGEHEDFVLVQTPAGRRGWIARAQLGFVVP